MMVKSIIEKNDQKSVIGPVTTEVVKSVAVGEIILNDEWKRNSKGKIRPQEGYSLDDSKVLLSLLHLAEQGRIDIRAREVITHLAFRCADKAQEDRKHELIDNYAQGKVQWAIESAGEYLTVYPMSQKQM